MESYTDSNQTIVWTFREDENYNNTEPFDLEPVEALSKPLQVFLICLYTVTALLALLGNATAIYVLMVRLFLLIFNYKSL